MNSTCSGCLPMSEISEGERLAALRKERGFKTQTSLAKFVGLTNGAISRMERTSTVPKWMWLVLEHVRAEPNERDMLAEGKRLAALRRERGFKTQRELAEYLGRSKATISYMERGLGPVPKWMWYVLKHARGD